MTASAQVAGIVLAAGFSRRLGRPKQTVVLAGETLVARAARVAREAGLSPVVVVLNRAVYELQADKLKAQGCTAVLNEEPGEGMAASIRLGILALSGASLAGAVVMTCDQVAVTAEHLRAMCAEPLRMTGSGYAGKVGVPAYFPVSAFAGLAALQGDQGARDLLRGANCVPTEALSLDVDTEDDLARADAWLREHRQR